MVGGEGHDANFKIMFEENFAAPQHGFLPGLVAVVGEDHLGAKFAQAARLLVGQGGAARRHCVGEPVLVGADDIHVAFHDQGASIAGDGFAGKVEGVQLLTLAIKGRLGRVDVLGFLGGRPGVENAGAKGDGSREVIADGEDEASAESVVKTIRLLIVDHEPGGDQRVAFEAGGAREIVEGGPGIGRQTQMETFHGFRIEAAPLAILGGFAVGISQCGGEGLHEKLDRGMVHLVQLLAQLILAGGARAAAQFRHGDFEAVAQ